jgi:RimJ/RimL family protein N-acetyltransferase
MNLTYYQKGDIYMIPIREGDECGKPIVEEDYSSELSWSIRDGNDILACFGICPMDEEGVGEMWAFISDDMRGHGLYLIKTVKAILDFVMESGKFHRLESIVRADREEYVRFSQMIGLRVEGVMEKATANKQDMYMFARVSDD